MGALEIRVVSEFEMDRLRWELEKLRPKLAPGVQVRIDLMEPGPCLKVILNWWALPEQSANQRFGAGFIGPGEPLERVFDDVWLRLARA